MNYEKKILLRDWLVKKYKEDHGEEESFELAFDSNLFDKGVLSSLKIIELLMFLENLKGEEIDTSQLDASDFNTIDAIFNGILS